jgi:hypothetical protein
MFADRRLRPPPSAPADDPTGAPRRGPSPGRLFPASSASKTRRAPAQSLKIKFIWSNGPWLNDSVAVPPTPVVTRQNRVKEACHENSAAPSTIARAANCRLISIAWVFVT